MKLQPLSNKKRWFVSVARGQAAVEFAMTALTWTMLLFGIGAFSLAIYGYSFVCQASRDAVRYAMVRGSDVTSGQQATCSSVLSFIQNEAHGISTNSISINAVYSSANNGASSSCTSSMFPDGGSNKPGKRVNVQVTYNFQPLYPMSSTVLPLTSTSQMVIVY